MGRWAQRRLAGGSQGQTQNFLVSAAGLSPTKLLLEYNLPLTASSLIPSQFMTDNGRIGTLAAQSGANFIEMTFDNSITLSAQLDYDGTTPNLKSPDFATIVF